MNDQAHKMIGTSLAHGTAHAKHHRFESRRSFLHTLGVGGAMGMMIGNMPVQAAGRSSLAQALQESDSDRILVLLQLNGGNDGLNTIIPLYDYDYYAGVRPRIRVPENQVLKVTDELGFHPAMGPLENMWNDGAMKVINNVGYANSSLSHFRGTDIWSSANVQDETISSGWLGRWLDGEYPDFQDKAPDNPVAIQIGSFGSPVFNNAMFSMAVNVSNPEELAEIARNGELFDVNDVPDNCYGDEVRFLRTVTNSTFAFAERIQEAFERGGTTQEYPTNFGGLADQLALVARLIKGGLGTRLYMVSLGSFDTHADQPQIHQNLWDSVARNVSAFYEDLDQAGWSDQVLTMTFSEFGRRIEENASRGTDHGTSAPLFLFGPGLEDNGFVGDAPNLQDQDMNGNLKFGTDFRSIYATVLEHWMCVEGGTVNHVLGGNYQRIEGLVAPCSISTSTDHFEATKDPVAHRALYSGNGDVMIEFKLATSGVVQLDLFDLNGRKMASLVSGHKMAGTHTTLVSKHRYQLSSGPLAYGMQVNGQSYGGLLVVP